MTRPRPVRRRLTRLLVAIATTLLSAASPHARSLTGALDHAIRSQGGLTLNLNNPEILPNPIVDTITEEFALIASRSLTFPGTSSARTLGFVSEQGLTGRWRRAGVASTEQASVAPLLHIAFAATFLDASQTELDGKDVVSTSAPIRLRDGTKTPLVLHTDLTDFELHVTGVLPSWNVGLGHHLDATVVIPLLESTLRGKVRSDVRLPGGGVVTPGPRQTIPTTSAFGVGDVSVRVKYDLQPRRWLTDRLPVAAALSLVLGIPSGSEENLQGSGVASVGPHLSLRYSPALLTADRGVRVETDLHTTVGLNLTPGDIERSRATYSAGTTLWIAGSWAVAADVIGTSDLMGTDTDLRVSTYAAPDRAFRIEPRNFVDFSGAIRWAPRDWIAIFAGAIVPLTDDGLRADVVPSAGIQLYWQPPARQDG